MKLDWNVVLKLACCATLFMSANAPAMGLFKNGDTIILHSNVVDGDERKLQEALTPDVKYVVLRGLSATDGYNIWALSKVIEAVNVTTVAHGNCSAGCTRMFLAGKQRMFSGAGRLETTIFSFGGFYFKSGSVDTKDYAYVSSHTEIPGKYMREYLQNRSKTLMVLHPAAKTASGATVFGCDGTALISDCAPIADLNALSAGIVTTNELFKSENVKEAEDVPAPPASGFAKISEIPPVATLGDKCKGETYQRFLRQESPRAFAISDSNACWWYNAQAFRPRKSALDACKKAVGENHTCKLYAVDDDVVFVPFN